MLKKFEDTYTHFDKIHERGRQTNGRTDGRTPRDDVGRAYPQHRAAKTNGQHALQAVMDTGCESSARHLTDNIIRLYFSLARQLCVVGIRLTSDSHFLFIMHLFYAIITSDKGGCKCFCLRLSVYLLARLRKNASCMDLDEMLRVDRCRDMDELTNF